MDINTVIEVIAMHKAFEDLHHHTKEAWRMKMERDAWEWVPEAEREYYLALASVEVG